MSTWTEEQGRERYWKEPDRSAPGLGAALLTLEAERDMLKQRCADNLAIMEQVTERRRAAESALASMTAERDARTSELATAIERSALALASARREVQALKEALTETLACLDRWYFPFVGQDDHALRLGTIGVQKRGRAALSALAPPEPANKCDDGDVCARGCRG